MNIRNDKKRKGKKRFRKKFRNVLKKSDARRRRVRTKLDPNDITDFKRLSLVDGGGREGGKGSRLSFGGVKVNYGLESSQMEQRHRADVTHLEVEVTIR